MIFNKKFLKEIKNQKNLNQKLIGMKKRKKCGYQQLNKNKMIKQLLKNIKELIIKRLKNLLLI